MKLSIAKRLFLWLKMKFTLPDIPAVQEKLNVLKEVVEDYTEQLNYLQIRMQVLVIKGRIPHSLDIKPILR